MSILRSASQLVENRGSLEAEETLIGWSDDGERYLDIDSPQMNTSLAPRPFSGL